MKTQLNRNTREMIGHALQQLIKEQFRKEPELILAELARRCNVSEHIVSEVYLAGRLPHMNIWILWGFVRGFGLASSSKGQQGCREVDTLTYDDCITLILRQEERQGSLWD